MKDEYTTYERRENIKLYLIKKRSTTTLQLSYMFGVSKRTILNDLVFLSSRISEVIMGRKEHCIEN